MRLIDADAYAADLEEKRDKCKKLDSDFLKYNEELEIVRRLLNAAPTAYVELRRHAHWIESKQHVWKRDEDGKIDFNAWSWDMHSGPECELCGESFCDACFYHGDHANYKEMNEKLEEETCKPHPQCSACKWNQMVKTPYCPNCGSIMDGKE